jgi:glutathione peroxidase
MTNAHDFSFTSIDGAPLPLSGFRGKAVLVVNTASACGLTPQYKGLEALWRAYRDRGLVVLGVPCNDFGAQEPGTEGEIKTFCETRFGVDFPMTGKAQVIGSGAHPFYQWAAAELGEGGTPRWNFHKYLVGKDGTLVATFGSRTDPEAADIKTAIEAALG